MTWWGGGAEESNWYCVLLLVYRVHPAPFQAEGKKNPCLWRRGNWPDLRGDLFYSRKQRPVMRQRERERWENKAWFIGGSVYFVLTFRGIRPCNPDWPQVCSLPDSAFPTLGRVARLCHHLRPAWEHCESCGGQLWVPLEVILGFIILMVSDLLLVCSTLSWSQHSQAMCNLGTSPALERDPVIINQI